ncbi:serine/threonine-protein kinase [Candidatus Uabimicrobium sp. HlEnr_7]|uniref:serine/threonine-protein kinase n=1 Tax=Candidatus Uabimicrobium helgolandensis TaxID=3095367 RepID=UPI003559339E
MAAISGYALVSILESTQCVPPKILDAIQKEMEQNPTDDLLQSLIDKNLLPPAIQENLENFLLSVKKAFPSHKNNRTQRQINPYLLPEEAKRDILFARIVLAHGFCPLETINKCFETQSAVPNRKKTLGQIMVSGRFLSGNRFIKIQKEIELKIQKKDLDAIIFEDKMTRIASVDGRLNLIETSIPKHFGSYDIISEIARGGMGVVYKAWDDRLKRTVALKVLRQWECPSVEETQRFLREARLAASLQHPNIVNIYDADAINGVNYFTMDYVEGEPLSLYLKEKQLTYSENLRIIHDIALALEYAHSKNVIHRDVKPGNIMIDKNGTPQLTDFGLAKALNADSVFITQSGKTMGTPAYMSPEQACGKDTIDARSDIYSLGAILYEMITGQPPFSGESFGLVIADVISKEPKKPSRINPYLPPDIEIISLKAMSKELEHRYSSAKEMADDINRYLFGESIKAKLNSNLFKIWKSSKVSLTVFFSILLGTVVIFGLVMWNMERSWQHDADVSLLGKTKDLLEQKKFVLAKETAQRIQQRKVQLQSRTVLYKSADSFIEQALRHLGLYQKNLDVSPIKENYTNIVLAFNSVKSAEILIGCSPKVKRVLECIYNLNLEIAKKYENAQHELWFVGCLEHLQNMKK